MRTTNHKKVLLFCVCLTLLKLQALSRVTLKSQVFLSEDRFQIPLTKEQNEGIFKIQHGSSIVSKTPILSELEKLEVASKDYLGQGKLYKCHQIRRKVQRKIDYWYSICNTNEIHRILVDMDILEVREQQLIATIQRDGNEQFVCSDMDIDWEEQIIIVICQFEGEGVIKSIISRINLKKGKNEEGYIIQFNHDQKGAENPFLQPVLNTRISFKVKQLFLPKASEISSLIVVYPGYLKNMHISEPLINRVYVLHFAELSQKLIWEASSPAHTILLTELYKRASLHNNLVLVSVATYGSRLALAGYISHTGDETKPMKYQIGLFAIDLKVEGALKIEQVLEVPLSHDKHDPKFIENSGIFLDFINLSGVFISRFHAIRIGFVHKEGLVVDETSRIEYFSTYEVAQHLKNDFLVRDIDYQHSSGTFVYSLVKSIDGPKTSANHAYMFCLTRLNAQNKLMECRESSPEFEGLIVSNPTIFSESILILMMSPIQTVEKEDSSSFYFTFVVNNNAHLNINVPQLQNDGEQLVWTFGNQEYTMYAKRLDKYTDSPRIDLDYRAIEAFVDSTAVIPITRSKYSGNIPFFKIMDNEIDKDYFVHHSNIVIQNMEASESKTKVIFIPLDMDWMISMPSNRKASKMDVLHCKKSPMVYLNCELDKKSKLKGGIKLAVEITLTFTKKAGIIGVLIGYDSSYNNHIILINFETGMISMTKTTEKLNYGKELIQFGSTFFLAFAREIEKQSEIVILWIKPGTDFQAPELQYEEKLQIVADGFITSLNINMISKNTLEFIFRNNQIENSSSKIQVLEFSLSTAGADPSSIFRNSKESQRLTFPVLSLLFSYCYYNKYLMYISHSELKVFAIDTMTSSIYHFPLQELGFVHIKQSKCWVDSGVAFLVGSASDRKDYLLTLMLDDLITPNRRIHSKTELSGIQFSRFNFAYSENKALLVFEETTPSATLKLIVIDQDGPLIYYNTKDLSSHTEIKLKLKVSTSESSLVSTAIYLSVVQTLSEDSPHISVSSKLSSMKPNQFYEIDNMMKTSGPVKMITLLNDRHNQDVELVDRFFNLMSFEGKISNNRSIIEYHTAGRVFLQFEKNSKILSVVYFGEDNKLIEIERRELLSLVDDKESYFTAALSPLSQFLMIDTKTPYKKSAILTVMVKNSKTEDSELRHYIVQEPGIVSKKPRISVLSISKNQMFSHSIPITVMSPEKSVVVVSQLISTSSMIFASVQTIGTRETATHFLATKFIAKRYTAFSLNTNSIFIYSNPDHTKIGIIILGPKNSVSQKVQSFEFSPAVRITGDVVLAFVDNLRCIPIDTSDNIVRCILDTVTTRNYLIEFRMDFSQQGDKIIRDRKIVSEFNTPKSFQAENIFFSRNVTVMLMRSTIAEREGGWKQNCLAIKDCKYFALVYKHDRNFPYLAIPLIDDNEDAPPLAYSVEENMIFYQNSSERTKVSVAKIQSAGFIPKTFNADIKSVEFELVGFDGKVNDLKRYNLGMFIDLNIELDNADRKINIVAWSIVVTLGILAIVLLAIFIFVIISTDKKNRARTGGMINEEEETSVLTEKCLRNSI